LPANDELDITIIFDKKGVIPLSFRPANNIIYSLSGEEGIGIALNYDYDNASAKYVK
jgi:hypothetical protein